MRSLTWDRGPEMAQHKQITLATKVDIYFCDPPSTLSGSCFARPCWAMRGTVARTQTPTACFAHTSQRKPIWLCILKTILIWLQCA
jgi:hypothetical protein